MILVAMCTVSDHLSVVVSTICHDAIQWFSIARPVCDYPAGCVVVTCSRCRSVDHLVRSELIFGLVRNCFGRHNCPHSAQIKLAWSCPHLSGALAVALIILQVDALVDTLDICPVLGALIISNRRVLSQASLRECCPLLLQACSLSLVWVSTSSFLHVDSPPHTHIDSASDNFKRTLID
jgi:hypothetical protein